MIKKSSVLHSLSMVYHHHITVYLQSQFLIYVRLVVERSALQFNRAYSDLIWTLSVKVFLGLALFHTVNVPFRSRYRIQLL